MTPVAALERVVHYLDRAFENGFKTKAFVRALDVVRNAPADEIERRAAENTLKELDGIGDATARVIKEALAGDTAYLAKVEAETRLPMSPEVQRYRDALRGDCHMHTRWSDGGAPLTDMVRTAVELGHEYIVITDHSPRLTVAHGLNAERLRQQLDEIDAVREAVGSSLRILTGIEVDILEDGSLDQDDDLLERLDIVVASVHSKLSMDHDLMTRRMLLAAANPLVDILGHCTGRMIGRRAPSTFDADYVFAACAQFNTAVEINCRPERLDPPAELIELALSYGCLFAMNSDAHSTGQMEWQPRGCEKAVESDVPIERIVNTWSADELVSWAGA